MDTCAGQRASPCCSALHDLTLAGQFADRLILLAAGRAAGATGKPARSVLRDDVLTGPLRRPGVQVLTTPDGERVVTSRRNQVSGPDLGDDIPA